MHDCPLNELIVCFSKTYKCNQTEWIQLKYQNAEFQGGFQMQKERKVIQSKLANQEVSMYAQYLLFVYLFLVG